MESIFMTSCSLMTLVKEPGALGNFGMCNFYRIVKKTPVEQSFDRKPILFTVEPVLDTLPT